MKIAVVGSGIAGLSAAWLIAPHHTVTLFEKENCLGGHAHTVDVSFSSTRIPVDTAFVVLNPRNYPHLTAFLQTLHVPITPTSMTLSVSMGRGTFEWSNDMPIGVFADWRNLFRPSFWRFLIEIRKFNNTALQELDCGIDPKETLETYLTRYGYSQALKTRYVFPIAGAIWSTSILGAKSCSAHSILGFLKNHGILTPGKNDPMGWHTVSQGSMSYVDRIRDDLQKLGASIRTSTPVQSVRRNGAGATVVTSDGTETFDYVVMATHADTTLKLLADADALEKELLSHFAYERNDVVLHSDPDCMPRRRRAWGAWNYSGEERAERGEEKVSLTYWMNRLQHIDPRYPLFVTLNPRTDLDPKLVHETFVYHHPIYTPEAIHAQSRLEEVQDKNRTLFCGSYFGHGFHEDGLVSAIHAVKYLGLTPPWQATV